MDLLCETIFIDGIYLCIDDCSDICITSCNAVELKATKTGNLISISTAHHQVGNAVVFHSHAAIHLMSVLHCNSYSFSILLCGCSCFILE